MQSQGAMLPIARKLPEGHWSHSSSGAAANSPAPQNEHAALRLWSGATIPTGHDTHCSVEIAAGAWGGGGREGSGGGGEGSGGGRGVEPVYFGYTGA